jgi:hypothetical protein
VVDVVLDCIDELDDAGNAPAADPLCRDVEDYHLTGFNLDELMGVKCTSKRRRLPS